MDKIEKLLKKVHGKDRDRILIAYYKIRSRGWVGLDMKKLSPQAGWRVRVGDFRIKFIETDGKIIVYDIQRRGDHTY